ncbi:hypothetical protein [Delftia deserti]|uniref:Uncharacterized protein n=1 Tax=Delftia deserti TaxID=1651218 RepID=A0ABW5ERZ0_9BURK
MKKYVLAMGLAAVATLSHAQFKGSIEKVMEEMGDFSPENNTFQVVRAKPLHIRLAARIMGTNMPEHTKEEVLRAVVYGVYRTFIHTDQAQVQVTAQPLLVTLGGKDNKLLDTPHATVTVTRAKALQVAQKTLGVKSFKELVDSDDTWSDKMQNGRYFTRKPGLAKLAHDLGVVYVGK